jgi:hypothetical protein
MFPRLRFQSGEMRRRRIVRFSVYVSNVHLGQHRIVLGHPRQHGHGPGEETDRQKDKPIKTRREPAHESEHTDRQDQLSFSSEQKMRPEQRLPYRRSIKRHCDHTSALPEKQKRR